MNIGKTGLSVSEIGFGAWAIGESWWGKQDDAESLKALHKAAELGANFIDTAAVYGDGKCERLIAQFRKEWKGELIMATKTPISPGPIPSTDPLIPIISPPFPSPPLPSLLRGWPSAPGQPPANRPNNLQAGEKSSGCLRLGGTTRPGKGFARGRGGWGDMTKAVGAACRARLLIALCRRPLFKELARALRRSLYHTEPTGRRNDTI